MGHGGYGTRWREGGVRGARRMCVCGVWLRVCEGRDCAAGIQVSNCHPCPQLSGACILQPIIRGGGSAGGIGALSTADGVQSTAHGTRPMTERLFRAVHNIRHTARRNPGIVEMWVSTAMPLEARLLNPRVQVEAGTIRVHRPRRTGRDHACRCFGLRFDEKRFAKSVAPDAHDRYPHPHSTRPFRLTQPLSSPPPAPHPTGARMLRPFLVLPCSDAGIRRHPACPLPPDGLPHLHHDYGSSNLRVPER